MASRPSSYGSSRVEIGTSDPGSDLQLIAGHASNPLPGGTCRGLWITTAGNITFRLENGSSDLTFAVALGLFPFRVSHVRAAGLTAVAYAIY